MKENNIPNYRKADCCQLCKHYKRHVIQTDNATKWTFYCLKYDVGIHYEWICDSFEHYEEK